MFGTNTYILSLSPNYVSHWGVYEAVRELLQNSLDSNSPFEYEFIPDPDGQTSTLLLHSKFEQLLPKTLLLGVTSKESDNDAIGSFGEGYKIAMLVLTRLGYDMCIYNRDRTWTPSFEFQKQYGSEMLIVHDTVASRNNDGVTFAVSGLSNDDIEHIRKDCLPMLTHIGEVIETKYGQILIDKPKQLYVGGLFVCTTELHYGYNIKPAYMKLERDRQTVSNWDLLSKTRDMWYDTGQWDRIAQMMDDEVPDLEYSEYSLPELVKEACFKRFNTRNPNATVAKSQDELDDLVKKGLTEVRYIGGGGYSRAITSSRSYTPVRQAHIDKIETPEETVAKWIDKNKKYMNRYGQKALPILADASKKWINK